MKNLVLQLFLSLFILALPFSSFCNDDSSIKFINEKSFAGSKTSFNGVQDVAYEEDKPIFITFHAVWSSPCQKMRQDVFSNEKVAEFMNENFINYSANIESKLGSALAEYYDVYHLPTTLIITPKGEVIVKNDTAVNHKQFLKWAKEANSSYAITKDVKVKAVQAIASTPVDIDDSDEPYVPEMITPRIRQDIVLND